MQDSKIQALLTDPDFLKLAQSLNRPNLFETLAVSHTELWHSAFLKWMLDPQSHLGLGDFPLKRFLFTVLSDGKAAAGMPTLTIGDVEDMFFDSMSFEAEFTDTDLKTSKSGKSKGGKAKIDVIGWSESISLKSGGEQTSVQLIIENKVKALEPENQTQMYYDWAMGSDTKFEHNVFVFLSVRKNKPPCCPNFIHITYQNLCDKVIRPCLNHPALPDESRYLLEQYLLNLGKPGIGGFIMADPNKEIHQKIYNAHKEVLDEIYVTVKSGAPQPPRLTTKNPNITLAHLVNNGLLSLSAQLDFVRHGVTHTAELKKQDSGSVVISHSGQEFNSASAAAKAISGHGENGLDVWRVQGSDKTLNELKSELAEQQNRASDDDEDTDEDVDN